VSRESSSLRFFALASHLLSGSSCGCLLSLPLRTPLSEIPSLAGPGVLSQRVTVTNHRRVEKMAQAQYLRAIGQSLEIFQVESFEIKKDGTDYVVQAEFLPQSGSQFILAKTALKHSDSAQPGQKRGRAICYEGSMRYSTMSISWLDAYGRRKRRNRSFANRRGASKLSHLLCGLGAYLDRMELSAFNIAWTPDRVSVECLKHGAQSERKTFSPKELYKLGLRMNFRRAPHSATA
jgi:hypothetical protein